MSLFFITGSAGTGKSTVCKSLKERGYISLDTDIDGLARWTNKETGYVHPKSSVKAADRTPEFIENHAWNVPREQIEQMRTESTGKLGFLCGILDNLNDVQDLFEGIIVLDVDKDTLRQRLSMRTGNDWGKQEHELQHTLQQHDTGNERYRAMGAIIIDATGTLDKVVDKVLAAATAKTN